MTVEETLADLTRRVQQLEADNHTLRQSLSELESKATPQPLASRAITKPSLSVLMENGRPLNGAYIRPDIRVGSSSTQPTEWELDGHELGIFQYGWYNLDTTEGRHVLKVSTLDGSESASAEFDILEG